MGGQLNPDDLLESSSDLFLCNNCGAFMMSDASRCDVCGTEMEESEEEEDEEGDEELDDSLDSSDIEMGDLLSNQGMILLCSECGAFLGPNSEKCGICGMSVEDMKPPEIEDSEDVVSADSRLFSDGVLCICEECGAFLKQGSEECTICGKKVFQELEFVDEKDTLVDEELHDLISEEIIETPEEMEEEPLISEESPIFFIERKDEAAREEVEIESLDFDIGVEDPLEELEKLSQDDEDEEEEPIKKAVVVSFDLQMLEEPPPQRNEITSLKTERESINQDIIDDCVRLWYKKATALGKLGRPKEALKCLNNALSYDPDDTMLTLKKADIYYEIGQYKQAAKLYSDLLKSEPDNVELLNKVGNALFRMGFQEESLLCFDKALALKEDHRETLVNKGYLLMKQERYDEAVECADKIVVITA
jgi:tetratricopeptide (TPR) repeat protein